MGASVVLEDYLTELSPGCCPDTVYGLVFNQAGQCLSLIASQYQFIGFIAGNLDDYKIAMGEDANRPRRYSATLSANQFAVVPETPPDEPYWLEWVLEQGVGGRATDVLIKATRFWWMGSRIVYHPMSEADLRSCLCAMAHVAVAYDSANHKLRFLAWLDHNGVLITNPQSCELKWLTRTGATILSTTTSTQMPAMPGFFQGEQVIVDITPDEVGPCRATIIDAQGNAIQSGNAVVVWD